MEAVGAVTSVVALLSLWQDWVSPHLILRCSCGCGKRYHSTSDGDQELAGSILLEQVNQIRDGPGAARLTASQALRNGTRASSVEPELVPEQDTQAHEPNKHLSIKVAIWKSRGRKVSLTATFMPQQRPLTRARTSPSRALGGLAKMTAVGPSPRPPTPP